MVGIDVLTPPPGPPPIKFQQCGENCGVNMIISRTFTLNNVIVQCIYSVLGILVCKGLGYFTHNFKTLLYISTNSSIDGELKGIS